MAKQITMPDDEMDGLYPSSEAPAETPAPEGEEGGEEEATESIDEEEAEGDTAVIDNKVLAPEGEPLKEGDEIVLVVVKNYGNESEVRYAPKSGGEVQPSGSMAEANSELDAMDQGY